MTKHEPTKSAKHESTASTAPSSPPPSAPISPPNPVSATNQTPTVGRIVHFRSAEHFDVPLPATIVVIHPESVELSVIFPSTSDRPGPRVVIASFSETPKVGHWSWPPKV